MEKISTPIKAYKNLEFLTSPAARSIRLLSEFQEPLSRFQKNKILDTIVFFGSARILSGNDAKANLEKVKNDDATEQEILEAEKILDMSKYYDAAVELAGKLTKWSMQLKTAQKRFIVCKKGKIKYNTQIYIQSSKR